MAITLQVIYPAVEGGRFDFDYYTTRHMAIVDEHMGPFLKQRLIVRGVSGGPDTPAPYVAVATLVFENEDMYRQGMAAAAPALADITHFTDITPNMLIGEIIA
ncbi:EthD family reductase [Roseibium aestuarii]|uniref:EthD family reductase n=1 Tax=Roseibium aestuarii TaxID=2600299 RepID=A0ABW4JW01_9HYPH|nr:EthD family reductase [Roseibium aestuarii]